MNIQSPRGNDLSSLYDVSIAGEWLTYALDVDCYTTFNGISSCVDTLCSKMSQADSLPSFSPVDGNFFTRKTCRNAQKYFDVFYDEKKVYHKANLAFRDSTMFDMGVMHCDEEDLNVKRVPTYEFFCDPYELATGMLSFAFREQKKVADSEIMQRFPKYKRWFGGLSDFNRLITYYDLVNGFKIYVINGRIYEEPSIKIEYKISPFVLMYWKESVKGFFTSTLCDDLFPLQCRVDEMELYIKSAARKAAKHVILSARNAKMKWSKNSNDIMEIWEYDNLEGGATPVFATPDPISQAYIQLRDSYLSQMYNMSGVSQASAMSHIQSNVKSGRMLETSQDIESERFNIPLKNYQQMYLDIARTCMEVFPKNQKLLNDETTRWGDIVKEKNKYKMQFTGRSVLSKDPDTRRQELQWYMSSGIIDMQQYAEMAQLPDTYRLDDIVNAASNYCETIIDRVLTENDPTDALQNWSPVVKLDLLLSKVARYRMDMDTAGEKMDVLKRLDMLYKVVNERITAAKNAANPPPPPNGPMPPNVTTNFKDLPPEAQTTLLMNEGLIQQPQGAMSAAENIPAPIAQ